MLQEIKTDKGRVADNPRIIAKILASILQAEDEIDRAKEHLYVIGTNITNKILYIDLVSLGTRSQTLVSIPEIFRRAISKGTDKIILAHNHPSGEVEPSDADRSITKRAVAAGKILEIELLDHVILGGENYYSFKEDEEI